MRVPRDQRGKDMTIGKMAAALIALIMATGPAYAANEEEAEDFMQLHQVEIAFHDAGSTKSLDHMLSLFADDASLNRRRKDLQEQRTNQEILASSMSVSITESMDRLYTGFSDPIRGPG
jgi:hypothetical protein